MTRTRFAFSFRCRAEVAEPPEGFPVTELLLNKGLLAMTPSRLAPLAAVLACALALSACANTVRGVGKDVKDTGKAVSDTVQ